MLGSSRLATVLVGFGLTASVGVLSGCAAPSPDAAVDDATVIVVEQADGASDSDESTDGLLDPCALATAEEIAEIFGTPFSEGVPEETDVAGTVSCGWQNADGASLPTASVTVEFGIEQAEQKRTVAEALGEVADVEIAGAADAFTYLYGEVVQMVVGEYLVTVNTAGTDAADGSPYSTAPAALVAPRL